MPKTLTDILDEEDGRADAEAGSPMLQMLSQVDEQAAAPAAPRAPREPVPGEATSQPNPDAPGFWTHLGRSIAHAPEVGREFLVRGVEGAADTVGVTIDRRDLQLEHEYEQRRTAGDVGTETGIKRAVLGAPAMATEMASLALPGGLGLFATAAGGNTTEDALDQGASPARARIAGLTSGAANLLLPGLAGRAVTPAASVVGRAVGERIAPAVAPVAEGAVHGAVTGEALNVGQAGATAVYNPDQALEQLEDPTMAVIGAAGGAGGRVPAARAVRDAGRQAESVESARLWDQANREAPTVPAPGPQMEVPERVEPDFDNGPHVQMLDMLARHDADAERALQGAVVHEQAVEEAARQEQAPPEAPGYDPELESINRDVQRAQRERSNQQLADEEAANLKRKVVGEDVDQGMQEQLAAQEQQKRAAEGAIQAAQLTETARARGMKGSFRHDPVTGQAEYQPEATGAVEPAGVTPEHIQTLSRSIDDLRAALTRQHTPTPDPVPERLPHEVPAPQERPPLHPEGEEVPGNGLRPAGGEQARGGAGNARPGKGRAVRPVIAEGEGQEARAVPEEGHGEGQAPDVAEAERGGQPAGEAGQRVLKPRAPEPAAARDRLSNADDGAGAKHLVREARPADEAAASPPLVTPEDLQRHIESTPIARRTKGYGEAMMSLIRARADSAGMPLEDYVGSRFAGVREGSTGSPSLNQGELLQGERLHVPKGGTHFESLAKDWRKATGDATPVQGSAGWQRLKDESRRAESLRKNGDQRQVATERITRGGPDVLHQEGGKQTDTPQFRQWFGESKVVDEKGVPQVVYHGTRDGRFQIFRHEKVGSGNGRSANGVGFYFAAHPETADGYRIDPYSMERKGRTIAAYLKINRPYRSDGHILHQDVSRAKAQELTDRLKAEGYDGIIVDHGVPEAAEYVVFDSKQIKSATDNRGTFDDSANILRQDKRLNEAGPTGKSEIVKRGSVEFLKDGRAIITAFEHADASTVLHELGHVFRRDLAGEDLAVAEKWTGVKGGKWTRPAEEKFARGFERWLRDGNAPTPELKSVFQHFYDWLHRVYETIRNSPIDVAITPEVKALFDRMFQNGKAPTGRRELPVKPSNDTQAPPLSGPGSDRMTNDRAVESAHPGASPEASRPSIKRDPSMNQKDFGRPDLAKQGATESGRAVEDLVDEARKAKPKGPTPDEVKQKAGTADVDDTSKVILERAAAGETYRNDEERAAAKIAVRKAVDEAGADPTKITAAARLVSAHRDVMAVWSKIGRQSWDDLESPEERYAHARQDAFDPPRGLGERMRAARKLADELFQKEGQTQKVARLRKKLEALEAENAARIAKLKRRVKGYGYDLDDPAAPWVHDPDQLQEVKRAIVAANGDTWDAAHEVYLNSRHWSANLINPLGGVKTSADAISIMTHFAFERPIEALANSFKGAHDSASWREFPEILKGFGHALTGGADGVPSVWRSFWRSLKDDTHAFDSDFAHAMDSENELHAFGANNYGQIPGKTGTALRFSIRMVKALDSAMKTLSAHMDVGAQAVRLARRDQIPHEDLADFIKRQIGDTESEAWHEAVTTARRLTFTAKPGVVVGAINKLKYMNPKNGGERALKEFTRYQFLFPGIPTQIIKRGLGMLPGVGPLMMLGKTGKAIYDTRPTGNGWSYTRGEFNRDLATSALAGGLATVLGTMVAGSKTDDGKNRVTGFNDKGRPTTIRLFGKDWNYKKALGPLAHPIATAMDFFQAVHTDPHEVDAHGKAISHWGSKERHGDDAPEAVTMKDRWHALTASIGEQALNESMWRSMIDLGKAVGQAFEEAAKPGEHVTADKLAKFVGNFVTGFIPTILKQAGGALNPNEEDRKLEGDFWNRVGQSALYNLDIPGAGQAPPKVGYFGQPITKETLGGPASTFLWRMTGGEKLGDAPDTSLGSRVVARWNEQHADHPFPAIPVKVPGATEAQRNAILERAGKATEERMTSIQGLNPNEPSFRSMRAILYLHQQEVQRAKRQVLGR